MVVKAWQDKSWQEIADAPVDALKGVSAGDAEKLDAAFNVETVRDLATLKFVEWAQGIVQQAGDGPTGSGGPISPEAAQESLEAHLYSYWLNYFEAEKRGEFDQDPFLGPYRQVRSDIDQAPEAVQTAHRYYLDTVELGDWGAVRYFFAPLDPEKRDSPCYYIVRVTTDGDDGWIELYGEDGTELGVGRTLYELVAWGERDVIREQVHTGEMSEEFDNWAERSLWGKYNP